MEYNSLCVCACVCVCVCVHTQSLSHVRHLCNPWTVGCQAPVSTGFSRQEYWSALPLPIPKDLPNPGIEPSSLVSPALQADSLPLHHPFPVL